MPPGFYEVWVEVYLADREDFQWLGPFESLFEEDMEYDIVYGRSSDNSSDDSSGSRSDSSPGDSSDSSSGSRSSGFGCAFVCLILILLGLGIYFFCRQLTNSMKQSTDSSRSQPSSSVSQDVSSGSQPQTQSDITEAVEEDGLLDHLSVQPDTVFSQDEQFWAKVVTRPQDRLRMRTGPDMNYDIIDNIPSGESVLVIGKTSTSASWVLVYYNDHVGWSCVSIDGAVLLEAVDS